MEQEIIGNEIEDVIARIGANMFKLRFDSAAAAADCSDLSEVAAVQISGAWNGEVQVRTTRSFATQMAAILFVDFDRTDIPYDLTQDCLREIANITAGNLKSVMPEPCSLSTPKTVSPAQSTNGKQFLTRRFLHSGDPIEVAVFKAS